MSVHACSNHRLLPQNDSCCIICQIDDRVCQRVICLLYVLICVWVSCGVYCEIGISSTRSPRAKLNFKCQSFTINHISMILTSH
ncbi:hypothetical protein FKM82_021458 [Ascaphus truei]